MITIYLNSEQINDVAIKELEIKSKINEHNLLLLILEISKQDFEKNLNLFLQKDIKIKINEDKEMLFNGIIREIITEQNESSSYYLEILASDLSEVLSNNNFKRIYQDFNISYKDIVEDVVSKLNLKYVVSDSLNKKIDRIFFQKEDDWSFLTRILSNINEGIFVNNDGLIMFGLQNLDPLELKNA